MPPRNIPAGAPKKLPKTLSQDEVAALMAVPNLAAPTGLRNRVALELMYRCGLRVSETCALHLRDWSAREHQLHIRPEIAKGGREAYLPLDPVVEEFLERWKTVRRRYAAGQPHLLTTLKGGPIDRHYCWKMIRRYARRAGLEDRKLHPHVLRHTFATDLLRDRFTVREVQQLMRHADLRTTAIYLHVHDDQLAEKIRQRAPRH